MRCGHSSLGLKIPRVTCGAQPPFVARAANHGPAFPIAHPVDEKANHAINRIVDCNVQPAGRAVNLLEGWPTPPFEPCGPPRRWRALGHSAPPAGSPRPLLSSRGPEAWVPASPTRRIRIPPDTASCFLLAYPAFANCPPLAFAAGRRRSFPARGTTETWEGTRLDAGARLAIDSP